VSPSVKPLNAAIHWTMVSIDTKVCSCGDLPAVKRYERLALQVNRPLAKVVAEKYKRYRRHGVEVTVGPTEGCIQRCHLNVGGSQWNRKQIPSPCRYSTLPTICARHLLEVSSAAIDLLTIYF
jgi:hypothetical protein